MDTASLRRGESCGLTVLVKKINQPVSLTARPIARMTPQIIAFAILAKSRTNESNQRMQRVTLRRCDSSAVNNKRMMIHEAIGKNPGLTRVG